MKKELLRMWQEGMREMKSEMTRVMQEIIDGEFFVLIKARRIRMCSITSYQLLFYYFSFFVSRNFD